MFGRRRVLIGLGLAALGLNGFALTQQEYKPPFTWTEPPVVAPGEKPGDPPADATVLFDGKSLDAWENGDKWEIADGAATVKRSRTSAPSRSFGDIQLHVEFATPEAVDPKQRGQGRGNSGVFLMDLYEVQVLDSYDNKPRTSTASVPPCTSSRRRWPTCAASRASGRPTTSPSPPPSSTATAS